MKRFFTLLVSATLACAAFAQLAVTSSQVVLDTRAAAELKAAPGHQMTLLDDELVTPPEDLETKSYPVYGVDRNGTYESTALIGAAGDDIYIKGLGAGNYPDAWVKGSMNNGKLVIPMGQYLGAYSTYSIYLLGSTGLTSSATLQDIVFDYDADNDVYTCDHYICINAANDRVYYLNYFGPELQIGGDKPTYDPVEVPASVTMETWTYNATTYTPSTETYSAYTNSAAKMGFDGNDVYLCGFYSECPEAVIKGTKNADGSLSFPTGQYLASDDDGNDYFFVVYNADALNFTFDGDLTYTSKNYYSINNVKFSFNFGFYYLSGASISQEVDEVVTPPEGLETEEWSLTYKSAADDTERTSKIAVQVGFTDDEVYIQGVWVGLPNAWIKGTLSDENVVIKSKQYLGSYSANYPDVYFMGFDANGEILKEVTYTIDAANRTLAAAPAAARGFETEQNEAITVSKTSLTYFARYFSPRFEPVPEEPATPADPKIVELDSSLSYFVGDIPTVDVQGNDLLTSKLYIRVWLGSENEITAANFTAMYFGMEEDDVELPYAPEGNPMFYFDAFGGNYPEGAKVIMFTDYDFMDYDRVGLQTVYYGGDERNESNIDWYLITKLSVTPDFGEYEGAQTVMVNVVNMPEDAVIEYTFVEAESENAPRRAEGDPVWTAYDAETGIAVEKSGLLTVRLMDASGEEITSIEGEYIINEVSTGVESLTVAKPVAAVRYYNAAGQGSDRAFDGVNIMVVTYQDGTQTVSKMVK